MKLTTIFLLAACLQLSAKGVSQTVSITVKDVPLLTVLKEIKKQTGYFYLADNEWLQKAKNVTIVAVNWPLLKVLDECFKGQPLTYNISGKVINIVPREEKPKGVNMVNEVPPIDVKGRVVNENGEPVQATITVKGTKEGTTTNENGEFRLQGVDDNAVLVISGVGIESKEMKVNGDGNLRVIVKVSVTPLEETIIKGYYTTTRRLNTGSVSKVTSETISKQPISNPISALQGRVPGIFIANTSGLPGADVKVQIRGQNSITAGNNPMYIIDGVPFNPIPLNNNLFEIQGANGPVSPFNILNPGDIESIEILKDADATAIYGSRAANGVVLITTKKAKIGKTEVNINIYSGVANITRMLDVLNTQQYLELRKEAYINDGVTPTIAAAPDLLLWDNSSSTNWQKEFLGKTAKINNGQITLSGGSENTHFIISGNYRKETTVYPGDFVYHKGGVHFNLEHYSLNKKFSVTVSGNYASDNNLLPFNDLLNGSSTILNLPPNYPLFDSTGALYWISGKANPIGLLKQKSKSTTENLIGNAIIKYSLANGLIVKTNLGYTKIQMDQTIIFPKSSQNPFSSPTSFSRFTNNGVKTYIVEPQANYSRRFGLSTLSAILGSTWQHSISNGYYIEAGNYNSEDILESLSFAGTINSKLNTYNEYKYFSVFSLFNFNLIDKYIVNFSFRRDGSSRFGPNKQYGNFGAIGAAWLFHNEKIIKNIIPAISYGKLRSSYGLIGNDQIQDYQYLQSYSFGGLYQNIAGLRPSRIANPNYSWEKTKKFEIGLELGFFTNRILLNTSWYRSRSDNQLVSYTLPTQTGFSGYQANLPALVENTGWEFDLNTKNIKGKFIWTTSINLTIPKNKLVRFPGLESSPYSTLYEIGKPLSIIKRYHFLEVDPQTGVAKIEDINNNSILSPNEDQIVVGKLIPDYYGGITNSFSYKGFQLEAFFQFVKQIGYNIKSQFATPPGGFLFNRPTSDLERWQKSGDITQISKATSTVGTPAQIAYFNYYRQSDVTISDASYIRLANLSLYYNFNQKFLNRLRLESFSIYIQGQNLFTKTRFLGMDPEATSIQGTPRMPTLRIITLGFSCTL